MRGPYPAEVAQLQYDKRSCTQIVSGRHERRWRTPDKWLGLLTLAALIRGAGSQLVGSVSNINDTLR